MTIRTTRKEDKDWFRKNPRSEWRIRNPEDSELEELSVVGDFALEMLAALRAERPELPIQMAVFRAGPDIYTTMPVKLIDGKVRIYNPVGIKLEILPGIEYALHEFKKLTGKSAAALFQKLEKAMAAQAPGGLCAACNKELQTGSLLVHTWQLHTDKRAVLCRECFYETSPQTHCVEKMCLVVRPGEVAATQDVIAVAAHMQTIADQVIQYKTMHSLFAALLDVDSSISRVATTLTDPTFSLIRSVRELYEYVKPTLQQAGLKAKNLRDLEVVTAWSPKLVISTATRYIWYVALFDELCKVKGGVTASYASLLRFREAFGGMAQIVPADLLDGTEFTNLLFLTRLHHQHGDKVYCLTTDSLPKLNLRAALSEDVTNDQLMLRDQVFTTVIPDELTLKHGVDTVKQISVAELDASESEEERFWAITLAVKTPEGAPKHINWFVPLPTATAEGDVIYTHQCLKEWISKTIAPETSVDVFETLSRVIHLMRYIECHPNPTEVYNTAAATDLVEKLSSSTNPKQRALYHAQLQRLEPRAQKIILV